MLQERERIYSLVKLTAVWAGYSKDISLWASFQFQVGFWSCSSKRVTYASVDSISKFIDQPSWTSREKYIWSELGILSSVDISPPQSPQLYNSRYWQNWETMLVHSPSCDICRYMSLSKLSIFWFIIKSLQIHEYERDRLLDNTDLQVFKGDYPNLCRVIQAINPPLFQAN